MSVLDGFAGALISRQAVEVTAFNTATVKQDTPGIGEMAVHAVVFHFLNLVGHRNLVFDSPVRFAFDEGVAAEFARQHDERAVEEAARFEVEHELRDGAIDLLFHVHQLFVAVLVSVPVEERDVFGGDFDVPGAHVGEPPGQQAAEAEAKVLSAVLRSGIVPMKFTIAA